MNNRGFTLIELLATILILTLVMSIGTYSVIQIVNSSRRENLNLLKKNIKDGAEAFYNECKYSDTLPTSVCVADGTGGYKVTLGNLVKYGFVTGNAKKSDDVYVLFNPMDNKDISACSITVKINGATASITANTTSGSCPTDY